MPTYPPSRPRRRRAAWPHIIILVIILVFVIVMTALGYAPEAAAWRCHCGPRDEQAQQPANLATSRAGNSPAATPESHLSARTPSGR